MDAITLLAGMAIGSVITAALFLMHKRRANVVITAKSIEDVRQLFRALEDGGYQGVAERLKREVN